MIEQLCGAGIAVDRLVFRLARQDDAHHVVGIARLERLLLSLINDVVGRGDDAARDLRVRRSERRGTGEAAKCRSVEPLMRASSWLAFVVGAHARRRSRRSGAMLVAAGRPIAAGGDPPSPAQWMIRAWTTRSRRATAPTSMQSGQATKAHTTGTRAGCGCSRAGARALRNNSSLAPRKPSRHHAARLRHLAAPNSKRGITRALKATFARIIEADPTDDYGQFALGLSAARIGDVRTAVEHLALATAMRPGVAHYERELQGRARPARDRFTAS